MATYRLIICLLLGILSKGSALDNNDNRLMRHEREIRRVEFSSSGELEEKAGANASKVDPGSCDKDFIFGILNSDSCDDRAHFNYGNLTESECIDAAEIAGAKTVKEGFEIHPEWQDSHPKGCFIFPCDHENGWCYFHNDIGDYPQGGDKGKLLGMPVCRRDKYKDGTSDPEELKDKDATDPALCAEHSDDYEVVMNLSECISAARCLGDCIGENNNNEIQIGINNASKREEFPPGCFKHAEQTEAGVSGRQCVYWNDPRHFHGDELFKPQSPVGTPICTVKKSDRVSTLDKDEFVFSHSTTTTTLSPA